MSVVDTSVDVSVIVFPLGGRHVQSVHQASMDPTVYCSVRVTLTAAVTLRPVTAAVLQAPVVTTVVQVRSLMTHTHLITSQTSHCLTPHLWLKQRVTLVTGVKDAPGAASAGTTLWAATPSAVSVCVRAASRETSVKSVSSQRCYDSSMLPPGGVQCYYPCFKFHQAAVKIFFFLLFLGRVCGWHLRAGLHPTVWLSKWSPL